MSNLEDDLCRAFAETVRTSDDFKTAFLERTKFAPIAKSSRLLFEEQVRARPKTAPENWWRHWWCRTPEIGREGETDIFLVFEDGPTGRRFAVHIENKVGAPLSERQAADYAPRARHMLDKPRYLSHGDFSTILLCPASYAALNLTKASLFDCVLHHEDVAAFVPAFHRTSPLPVRSNEPYDCSKEQP